MANKPARDDVERALHVRGHELSPRTEHVIRMLYGLTPDGKAHSAEELAQQMRVARVRVLQAKDRALRQLGFEDFP